ncbi:antibiotic biosynthesis monooxygenase [Deinococcus sp. HMF7604]|uniref:antibiotic biosynthesis monooxygenase family protein n=1 Tax=Deinococcus betulae TaxID=2873312 RepID=UPI001CCC6239|nr:antibiotic biosynthesis monooxygenase [Deinococcus betulae]MBZ9749524.1 antibiotic biosynthesis monooxygenase [Deinococcus betulae]
MDDAVPGRGPVLEVALLDIRPGLTTEFEAAFAEAQTIISSMPGYLRHTLQRCLEADHHYVLLVWWESLEAHTVGFRGSPDYQRWRTLLHHFYDPFPTVEHFVDVAL